VSETNLKVDSVGIRDGNGESGGMISRVGSDAGGADGSRVGTCTPGGRIENGGPAAAPRPPLRSQLRDVPPAPTRACLGF
jgi:hypothetical protein